MKILAYILFSQGAIGLALVLFTSVPFTRDIERKENLESLGAFTITTAHIEALEREEIESTFEEEKKRFQQAYWSYLEDTRDSDNTMTAVGFVLITLSLIESLALFVTIRRKGLTSRDSQHLGCA